MSLKSNNGSQVSDRCHLGYLFWIIFFLLDKLSGKLTKYAGHFRNLAVLSDRPAVFAKTAHYMGLSALERLKLPHRLIMQKKGFHIFLVVFNRIILILSCNRNMY